MLGAQPTRTAFRLANSNKSKPNLARQPRHPHAAVSPLQRGSRTVVHAAAGVHSTTAGYDSLLRWCIENHGLPPPSVEPAIVDAWDKQQEVGLVTSKDVRKGDVLLEIPGDLGVTSVDIEKDPALAALASGRSELVGLALWLMKEQSKGAASSWAPLLATLPDQTLTPILWDDDERQSLLRGSTVLEEARSRQAALEQEWEEIAGLTAADPATFPPAIYNAPAFLKSMSVILACASYLPTAQCFALLPIVGTMARTGSAAGAVLDYDLDRQAVTLTAAQPSTAGQEVKLFDGRPNGELLLARGTLEPGNAADYLTMPATLVAADKLYATKREIVTAMGFDSPEQFPIYEDRIALQQLTYLRLARIQDPAQLAKVSFNDDVIISVENEYEVLQLMMGDLRERLQAYATEYEEDLKDLQRRDLTEKQRAAIQLRFCEKRILRGTMNGVRKRLAPIRGIPTKQGFQDPNSDLKEIFDTLEAIPAAPKKLMDGILSWAKGEQDPDWKKK